MKSNTTGDNIGLVIQLILTNIDLTLKYVDGNYYHTIGWVLYYQACGFS